MEIAVIGNSEFILGFRLAGIRKTYAAENDEKLNEHITRVLQDSEVAILVLNSSDMEKIPRRLRATLDNSVKPTVIAIGGEEKGGLSMRERIKRSVGVDLWK
jgi:V/A-type H+/Na+-transporting ATPase subunit F